MHPQESTWYLAVSIDGARESQGGIPVVGKPRSDARKRHRSSHQQDAGEVLCAGRVSAYRRHHNPLFLATQQAGRGFGTANPRLQPRTPGAYLSGDAGGVLDR